MKLSLTKRPGAILGLHLDRGQLSAALVTRTKDGTKPGPTVTAAWTLDLQHPEAAAAGLELRARLDAAGLTERRCAVSIPAAWVMSHQTKTPALSPEDLDGYLQLEAEKGFPCDRDELQIARSTSRQGDTVFVTQLAVPREKLDHLAAVLKAAGLKPVSLSLGLATLPDIIPAGGQGRLTVAAEATGTTLLVASSGGIASLRTSEAVTTTEGGAPDVAALIRELRITVEQLPAELRPTLTQLSLCGSPAVTDALAAGLAGWAAAAGLALTKPASSKLTLGEEMALGIADRVFASPGTGPEFLPPQPSRWAAWRSRYDGKRLAYAGFAAGAALVLALGCFGWQFYRLWSLRSAWGAMQAQVADLEAVQARIHDYRPWYDTSFRNLSILRRVTECFPDSGSVTAKSLEIRGLNSVSIAGTARDNTSLLAALDQLRKTREVQGLKIEQIHGKSPLQFTFSFRWNPNAGS